MVEKKRKNLPIQLPTVKPQCNMFGATSGVTSTQITLANEGEGGVTRNTWLRRVAGLIYTTSPTPMSLPILLQDPQFAGKISKRSVEKWCIADHWVEKRKQHFDQLEAEIKRKVQTAQLRSRFEQLQELDKLSGKMHNKLQKDEVEPGTYEGMVGSLVKVESMRDDLRSKISKEVVPENLIQGVGQGISPIVPILSEEEARIAALAIIRKRQADAKVKRKEETSESIDDEVIDDG